MRGRSIRNFLWAGLILVLFAGGLSAAPGESLHYRIRWGFVNGGYAVLDTSGPIQYKGRDVIVYRSRAWTNRVTSVFFKVKDKIVSYYDPVQDQTLYSFKNLREGKYLRKSFAYFNHKTRSVAWSLESYNGNTSKKGETNPEAKWKKKKGKFSKLPPNARDLLSTLFYLRAQKQKGRPGDSFRIPVFEDGKLIRPKMLVLGRDKLKLKINGKKQVFPCLIVEPIIKHGGFFKSGRRIRVWLSTDGRRLPLMIKAKIPFAGHVTVELYKYRAGKKNF